jgi:hypothetical protein
MVYEKCYHFNRENKIRKLTAFCGKYSRDFTACCKNAVIFFVVEYYLLGISPASELSESTFRNLVSVPSS